MADQTTNQPKLLPTDEEIGAWTSTHDQMAWGQSMIPTRLVTAKLREIRDLARALADEDALTVAYLHGHTEGRRIAEVEWERVPNGLYPTKHGDGLIGVTTATNQLSVAEKKRNMRIYVGTLPDGWEIRRRVKRTEAEAATQ